MSLLRMPPVFICAILAVAGTWPAAAQARAVATVPVAADQDNVLRIPGFPPIPLPPGTHVFGPGDRPDAELSAPPSFGSRARPLPPPEQPQAPAKPKSRSALLDELFARLKSARDPDESEGIAGAIERVWLHSGSDTADLLMGRALEALTTQDTGLCLEILGKVVQIDPDWAEGWDKRASVRFFADDYDGAMEDFAHVLALEPRHFGALAGMGFVLEKSKLHKEALRVFRRALEIYPQQDEIRKMVDKLTVEVEGQDI
jgi:tetratricopeptide (TPR) repeat protein